MGETEEKPLSGLIKNVIKELEKRGHFTEEEITRIWCEVVGKKAAAHTRPASFKKGVLAVNVDGSAWLYELTTRKREILKGLEEKFKGKKIKEVRFRIGEIKAEER